MSTKNQISASYDVSNEFFRLWLDEGMSYSCALFEGSESLEAAQIAKLEWIADAAGVTPGQTVLDIGCGWGANLRHLVEARRVERAVGITLSEAQLEHVSRAAIPRTSVECVDYRDFAPKERFDAVISIGMFEHIATPEEARSKEILEIYRDYFRRVWEWTKPGARFGLQSVIGALVPRDRADLRDLAWVTYTIFPGAITPRIEAIAASVNPYWEILYLHTRREHYEKTAAEWLRRLRERKALIAQRWGAERVEEYERYLATCVTAFRKNYQSLVQISLRRCD